MSFLISTPRRDYETRVRRQVLRLRMKAPLDRAIETLKEPSISYLYTARFQLYNTSQGECSIISVLSYSHRACNYCKCRYPAINFRILNLIGRTHSNKVDSLSGSCERHIAAYTVDAHCRILMRELRTGEESF